MAVVTRVQGPAHVLACTGKVMLGAGDEELIAACEEALAAGARWIVLDLSKVTYLDSSGIGAVVSCSKRAADRAAVMRLVVAETGPVRKVLEMTHLDRAFDVFGSAEEAVKTIPR
jgi:anti-sigma B factor antagonist